MIALIFSVVPTGEVDSRMTRSPAFSIGRDRACRGFDIGHVGAVVGAQRRRHGDDVGVGVFVFERGAQLFRFDDAADERVEIGLAEMGLALIDLVDDVGLGVDADDLDALIGEHGRRRQADIAEADNFDLTKLRPLIKLRTMRPAARPSP